MEQRIISPSLLGGFCRFLREGEYSAATIEKYRREVGQFAAFLGGAPVRKEAVAGWKAALLERGYASATVNAKLSALDAFLAFQGWEDCRVKHLRLQRRLFQAPARELSRGEFHRLVEMAQDRGRRRLALALEAICATGIRVSELKYITVEAAQQGKAEISLKGKVRTILIPGKLSRKLLKYAGQQKTASGEIFLTRSGKSLSWKQLWAEMKEAARTAGVAASKVFPHNLRHLFARVFYQSCRDVAKLADVLGHSSVETTRIYLISTGAEHAKTLEGLHLIS